MINRDIEELRTKLTHVFIAEPTDGREGIDKALIVLEAEGVNEGWARLAIGLVCNGIAADLKRIQKDYADRKCRGERVQGTDTDH